MPGRRRYGSIRKRESGRWQVRYRGPDGRTHSAPDTFERKSDAERYLSLIEAQLARGEWIDPARGRVTVQDYAERWITERPGLRPRTVDLYRWLLRKHITPYLGSVQVGRLDTAMVREWRAQLLGNGVSAGMAAKAYRLLRAVLTTAVNEDEMIRRNPCRIPGADQEHPAERPVLTAAQVFALARLMPDRYRALVLLATFASLRWGEAVALQRRDIDPSRGTVEVRQALVERTNGEVSIGPPKSRAGRRLVTVPAAVLPPIREHLDTFVPNDPDGFLFAGPHGGMLRRGYFRKRAGWPAAVAAVGCPGLHFHDLRHTGNTLASRTGASTRDLMARMGHDSARAALIYQHTNQQADKAIADGLNAALNGEPGQSDEPDDPDDGAAGALVRVR